MYTYGKPATWANRQKWLRRKNAGKDFLLAGIALVAAVAASFFIYRLHIGGDGSGATYVKIGVVLVLLGAAVVFCGKRFSSGADFLDKASKAHIGVESERQVRSVIKRQQRSLWIAAFGIVPGKRMGDIDLSLVTSAGVCAAVEIKTGFGEVSVGANGLQAGRKSIPKALPQAQKNSERLSRILGGADVVPAVCIPGMNNPPFWVDGEILVCAPKDLVKSLNRVSAGMVAFTDASSAKSFFDQAWRNSVKFDS